MRKVRMYPPYWEPWTDNEDAKLRELYVSGTPVDAIAAELRRSTSAIAGRAHLLKINRPREARFLKRKVAWEVLNFYGLEAVSPSLQPLETKGIQEFLLAISDFLKSVELVRQGGKTK